MKRYFVLAASVCALMLALAAGPAFAGTPLGGLGQPGHDNGQSNTALLSNDPVLSGNSVAVVNTGSQESSANADATQVNEGGSSGGDQSNTAVLSNDPVASGNSVAVVNGGGCSCDSGSQSSSADADLTQVNSAPTDSHPSDGYAKGGQRSEDVDQSNTAVLSNDPVASGNSVALINTGDQSSSADATLTQVNTGGGSSSDGKWSKDEQGSRSGDQSNTAILANDPVASGNSVAVINTGDQSSSSSSDTHLKQVNGKERDERSPKGDRKPCPKPEPKPCPKPEPKPCPRPEPKPCPKPAPKPCPEPKQCCSQPKECCPQPEPCRTSCDDMVGIVTGTLGQLI